MTIEATIDLYHQSLKHYEVGDEVGDCKGMIMDTGDIDGALVKVNPDPKVCQHCSLSEYCTQSLAD